jgi:hypothetical protein
MSNFSSIRNVFENPNRSRDARPPPLVDTRAPHTEIPSPPRPLLDEIIARQERTSSSSASTETQSPLRPVINSSHRLPVFSGPQDELSKLKEDIMRLSGTFNNVQAMLSNMYQRIEILEEKRQSAQHPTRPPFHNPSQPPFHNPSQPMHSPALYSTANPEPMARGGSLEEKYIKYKSKYNKLKNKLI